jgi:hypothetical protein
MTYITPKMFEETLAYRERGANKFFLKKLMLKVLCTIGAFRTLAMTFANCALKLIPNSLI